MSYLLFLLVLVLAVSGLIYWLEILLGKRV